MASPAARLGQQIESGLLRQTEVEQHHAVALRRERELRGPPVAHPVDREAGAPQAFLHGRADHGVVFDE